ncbi:unnamed protein product [Somion occarium]|uniref:DUF300-domain-containing protein n=1 Tax=Somion occarium TaxID=3059160 RepID=A0ABP1DVY6_9APHY
MANIVNGTCHAEKAPQEGPPLIQHGNLVFQAHHVGWIITGCFTTIATVASFWLINKHLQWYTNKREQRYIVRILFMVPIYAMISFASYLFWNHSTPLLLLRDCYESTVLTSFFYLLLTYLSPDPAEQKEIFRKEGLSRENDREARRKGQKPRKWVLPLGFVRWKPQDGLYFLQLMKWGVLQYCVIRPTTTLAAVILDYSGLYCEDSWSPGWGHIYITVIVSISVTIAMYCLVQLYVPVSGYLKPQKPILKLFAIKAVVFLTFWQATGLSFLTMLGVVKDTTYMTADNINIGLGAILETLEMTIFAFLHIRAFTYKPYRTPPDRTSRWRSLMHAMNFKETLRELWVGTIYLARRARGKETDTQARREAALEDVFGRTRFAIEGKLPQKHEKEKGEKSRSRDREEKGETGSKRERNKDLAVSVDVDKVVHVGEERQWLGLGDRYAYSMGYAGRKERSGGLEEQIEKELAKRGYEYSRRERSTHGPAYDLLSTNDADGVPKQNRRRSQRTSWWRNVYNRLSQSHADLEPEFEPLPLADQRVPSKKDRSPYHKPTRLGDYDYAFDFEDPPPPSAIRSYRASRGFPSQHRKVQASPPDAQPDPHYVPTTSTPASAYISSHSSPSRLPSNTHHSMPVPHALSQTVSSTSLASSPPTESSHPDSFLARVFPYRSDASHSGEALSSVLTLPSSQSHHSRVHLGGDRRVVANGVVTAQAPSLVPSRPQSHAIRSQEAIIAENTGQLGQLLEEDEVERRSSNAQQSNNPLKPARSSHHRDSAQYQPRIPDAEMYSRYPDEPERKQAANARKLRLDRLVMPTPLAPSPSQSLASPPTGSVTPFARYTTSPTQFSPNLMASGNLSSSRPSIALSSSQRPTRPSVPDPAHMWLSRPLSHPASDQPSTQLSDRPPVSNLRRSSNNLKRHSYVPDHQRHRGRSDRRTSALVNPISSPAHEPAVMPPRRSSTRSSQVIGSAR